MINKLLLAVCLLFFGTAISQDFDEKVLFTIDKSPVYASEFLQVYNKNLGLVQDESQKDVDEYLEMFINYKLKVRQAQEMGLDKDEKFQKEFQTYRNQLAKKFLTDVNVTEALVQEAYERSIEEINAAHILIRVSEDASPEDTLAAYNKAIEIRNEILSEDNFAIMAKQFSEDPSARMNAGELGWFNAFKMVYPFEDAAYNTPNGEISMPVRTSFGYHLIKVNDRRKSQGEVTAAHIMIAENKNNPEAAKAQIEKIFKQLNAGEEFAELAEKHSDDKATAEKGGKLNRFAAGTLNSAEFEKQAFQLSRPGEISQPFKTKYGWHIVQLLEKHPVQTFAEMRPMLENKVKNDSRSRIITEKLVQDLKNKYQVKKNPEALKFFQSYVGPEFLKGKWNPGDETALTEKEYVRIKDSAATYKDFSEFIRQKQRRPSKEADLTILLQKWHEDFIRSFILNYHQENLEKENPEFAAIVREYKEGLLLFDLMEQKIWNQAKVDTLGLEKYYQENRKKYPEDFDFEATKGMVVNDYQQYLEQQWLESLRKASKIKVKRRTFKKVKSFLE